MFGVVELQCAADAVQDGVGYPGSVAAFEADVVLNTDAGDEGDFLAAKPVDAAAAPEEGEPGLFGGEPGAASHQKLAELGMGVHEIERRRGGGR